MDGQPTTGPMVESTRPRTPHNFMRFDTLMSLLQEWRSDDHQDAIMLHRSQVIEIIEGVKALRTLINEIAAMDPKGIRADDLGRAARLAAASR